MSIPFLGELPLDPGIRVGGDTGRPVALLGKDNPQAQPFLQLAKLVVERCGEAADKKGPSISVED